MNVFECAGLHKSFERGKDVLHGVSFSIGAGEVVGLLGKNGAGKTTLMRIAMGLIAAREGEVRIFGLDPRRDPIAVKTRVGYVSEEQILLDFLIVKFHLRLSLNPKRFFATPPGES